LRYIRTLKGIKREKHDFSSEKKTLKVGVTDIDRNIFHNKCHDKYTEMSIVNMYPMYVHTIHAIHAIHAIQAYDGHIHHIVTPKKELYIVAHYDKSLS